jgi:hypothetical protein
MAYLYLGNDVDVHRGDILGIFDIERVTSDRKNSKQVNDYLRTAQKSGNIYYVSLDLPKSFIVTDDYIYISNISTHTLKKRGKNGKS